jgi:hypothetical protein
MMRNTPPPLASNDLLCPSWHFGLVDLRQSPFPSFGWRRWNRLVVRMDFESHSAKPRRKRIIKDTKNRGRKETDDRVRNHRHKEIVSKSASGYLPGKREPTGIDRTRKNSQNDKSQCLPSYKRAQTDLLKRHPNWVVVLSCNRRVHIGKGITTYYAKATSPNYSIGRIIRGAGVSTQNLMIGSVPLSLWLFLYRRC